MADPVDPPAGPVDPPAGLAGPGYPRHWEADAVLADGGTVHLRPILPSDADRLRAFHGRLSPETVYNRFFSMVRTLSARDVERFTQVDHDERAAVVALLRDELIAVVRYSRFTGTADAEVAVVVEDAHQGRGLGPLLLEHLAAAARERGIERFVADVLPGNRRMIEVFRSAGFETTRELEEGYVELSYPIRQTAASLQVARSREHRAEARSVARLLWPKAVAVIGASREPGTVGHEVFASLLDHGFEGPAYPVNPDASHVRSVRAYADIRDVPDEIDLAVIAVPAAAVADVVRACVDKRVRGLVVVSGGFTDAGEQGRARLAEVVALARDGGLRLIGPNAMGVVNTDPAVRLHASFAPGFPPQGRVGLFSQSGALAGTLVEQARRRGIGISTFVSIGDRADVSGNDLLQYWQQDQATDVVLLHLQGFGNPRKFARISRDLGRTKPVIALKSGRGRGDAAVDAMFASAGVVRVDTLTQLFDAAQLFAHQPLPAGRRVGIVGNSTALAAIAADACRTADLHVPELPADVRSALTALTGTTEAANPVDLGPLSTAAQFDTALRQVAASGAVDALFAVVAPTLRSVQADIAAALRQVGAEVALPVLASYLGHDGVPPELAAPPPVPAAPAAGGVGRSGEVGPSGGVRQSGGASTGWGSVPSYASPESAALALSRAAAYAEWRARPQGELPVLTGVDIYAARAVVSGLPPDGRWLAPEATAALLGSVGVPVWPAERVTTLVDALEVAGRLGWPVALKSADARWRSRVDVGAVRLDLHGPAELTDAFSVVRELTGPGELIVQPMAPAGVSTVVRLVQDPAVGPLLSLRLGGVVADLLADPITYTLPLTDRDAHDLVRGVRGASLLLGLHGAPAADVDALEDLLHRIARLAEELPSVAEVLLDPVLVGVHGVTVLHAGVRLLPPELDPEAGPRRLVGSGPAYLR